MKKTITITAPEGKVINFNEANGTVIFEDEPKSVIERILNFEDVLKEHKIEPTDFLKSIESLSSDEVAYRKLKLIVSAFNEGWTPDWTNGKWDKYVAYFTMGGSSGVDFSYCACADWYSVSFVGSRLVFKSSDLAKHVANLFIEDFRDFLTTNIE
ncbi:MAG: hypothetical protein K2P85_00500 [Flavobacteriaceae bacterium]|nr:hypothetical protein [Flavobacteriaceae bacterium]